MSYVAWIRRYIGFHGKRAPVSLPRRARRRHRVDRQDRPCEAIGASARRLDSPSEVRAVLGHLEGTSWLQAAFRVASFTSRAVSLTLKSYGTAQVDLLSLAPNVAGHEPAGGVMEDPKLAAIVRFLNEHKVRATYKAVAEVLGVLPISMGRRLGPHYQEASWIVNAKTGLPTGYARADIHPDVLTSTVLIRTGAELRRRMQQP
jgi:hypothetical protein